MATQSWVNNFESLHKKLENIGIKVNVLGCQALAEGDGAIKYAKSA